MGNITGKVHSHRFPAANTALPTANEDADQLKATENFLTSGALTVDIFALSAASPLKAGASAAARTRYHFRRGRRSGSKDHAGDEAEAAPVTAPLNRVQPAVRRGDTVRVDVVVRTKRIGHFFRAVPWMPTTLGWNSKASTTRDRLFSGAARWKTMARVPSKKARTFIVRSRSMRTAIPSTSATRGQRVPSSTCV